MSLPSETYLQNRLDPDAHADWARRNIVGLPLRARVEWLQTQASDLEAWTAQAELWAQAADGRYRACSATRPSRGAIRIGVKDTIDIRGMPTGLGLPRYRHYPKQSATLVAEIEDQICAKLVTTELNIGRGSGCLNPYFPDVDPAGSSTGCGVAVAAGICDIALGTDVLGSIRWPAGRCGVVGLRETNGLAPLGGVFPLAPSMDAPGWVARTAEDLAFFWEGHKGETPISTPGMTVAVLSEAQASCTSQAMLNGLHTTVEALTALGHRVVAADLGEAWGWRSAAWELCASDLWRGYQTWNIPLREEFSRSTQASVEVGKTVSQTRREEICAAQSAFRQADLFGSIDAWLLPLDAIHPPKIGSATPPKSTIPSDDDLTNEVRVGFTPLASFLGLPAITFPVPSQNPFPVAMQLVGPRKSDASLIALLQQLESVFAAPKGYPL